MIFNFLIIVWRIFFVTDFHFFEDKLPQKIINVRDFGAIPNDNKDDYDAFRNAIFKTIEKPGKYLIVIPSGIFNISKPIIVENLQGEISFQGNEETIVVVNGSSFGLFMAKHSDIKVLKEINRADTEIILSDDKNINIQDKDIIHLKSNSVFEVGWNYLENDTHRIRNRKGNKVSLSSPVVFNYDFYKETVKATLYKHCKLSFADIRFELDSENRSDLKPQRRTLITIWGVALDVKNVELCYSGKESFFHIGFSIFASENISFNNISMEGFSYGVLLNYCRNLTANNTIAIRCRHAYTPSQGSFNVTVNKLRGERCHSVMDAHVSFFVTYKNVVDTLATQFPNCRALGTTIENTRVYLSKNASQDYAYWSVQTLSDEYRNLYKEFDTKFLSVEFVVANPSAFNGLTTYSCRNFIVDNCITSSVAFYGDAKTIQKVLIKNSRVGVIRIDGQKTHVSNTVLDGNLFPSASYVFRFSGLGVTIFDGVIVKNYDSQKTFLFDRFYNQPGMNKLIINNSKFGKLKGFSKGLVYPGMRYNQIVLNESTFDGFEKGINPEFPQVIDFLKEKKRGTSDLKSFD